MRSLSGATEFLTSQIEIEEFMTKPIRSNAAPMVRWFRQQLACGTIRYSLYVNGQKTPYFIDAARSRAHYSYGSRIGLWGAGMGQLSHNRSFRIAGFLGGYDTIALAKHVAEQHALD